ncbi:MAG: FAD-binding oxidoreductase [Gemmatimonadota bacterium]
MPVTPNNTPFTVQRHLRRGRSLWADLGGYSVTSKRLTHDLFADVVVVGTGVSGALVAHALSADGHAVTMIDRRLPITGSTMASTALLQFEIDIPLHALAEKIGQPRAIRAYRRSVQAVSDLGTLVRRERIRCSFTSRDSLYLAGDAYGHRALAHETAMRARAGIPGEFVSEFALRTDYGIERTGAIISDGSAAANPAQLTAGVLRRLRAKGMPIYHGCNVLGTHAIARGVAIELESGHTIVANTVVFCTGYETVRTVPTSSRDMKSTWAIGTGKVANIPGWLRDTVVWEASDPYLYLRTTQDGRLVAGGHDVENGSRYSDPALLSPKGLRIADDVTELLPELRFKVTHEWAGAFAESPTGLPLIGPMPGTPRAWVVAGFGGNGITYSMIASQVVAAGLRGERDPDAGLYRVPE